MKKKVTDFYILLGALFSKYSSKILKNVVFYKVLRDRDRFSFFFIRLDCW